MFRSTNYLTNLFIRFGNMRYCLYVSITLWSISFCIYNPLYQTGRLESLDEKLKIYEIIEVERRLEKKGFSNVTIEYNRQEILSFRAFGRTFEIYLTPKKGIFHYNFIGREVNSKGDERRFILDPQEHFGGHVHGSVDSVVSLTFDEFDSMLGVVHVDQEIFVFEPARLHKADLAPNKVLIYRESDMKVNFMINDGNLCFPIDKSFTVNERKRWKRENEVNGKKRCSLRLVADYKFFTEIGNASLAFTARYLINVIDRINALYTQTDWGKDENDISLINMGFMIKDMIIHNESTTDSPNHYNAITSKTRDINQLLDSFSREQGSGDFCLVHLFTAQSFDNVLGLGYVSSPDLNSVGGICSAAARTSTGSIYYNTALSTVKSAHGSAVITREADIVTAHEFGHNWGAMHDDESEECSPPYSRGGSYIMNTYSVSGYDANNNHFSPCSRRMIGKVLSRKAHICFEEEKSSFCGNNRIENNSLDGSSEECDVGGQLLDFDDKCCTPDCRLRKGAVCSPKNFPCCSSDCQYLPSTHICLHDDPFQCKLSSYCTGTSGECPEPGPIADGTKCFEDGECLNGRCLTFCERPSINKKPCICHNEATSCLRCCRSENGSCEPYKRSPKYILKDGTRCIHGYCRNAICIKEVADPVSHFWSIMGNIDETNFLKFIEDNLVGVIAIVTLILWIPISILIYKFDKETLKQVKLTENRRIEVVAGEKIASATVNPQIPSWSH